MPSDMPSSVTPRRQFDARGAWWQTGHLHLAAVDLAVGIAYVHRTGAAAIEQNTAGAASPGSGRMGAPSRVKDMNHHSSRRLHAGLPDRTPTPSLHSHQRCRARGHGSLRIARARSCLPEATKPSARPTDLQTRHHPVGAIGGIVANDKVRSDISQGVDPCILWLQLPARRAYLFAQ
jgi:hypothetical protein